MPMSKSGAAKAFRVRHVRLVSNDVSRSARAPWIVTPPRRPFSRVSASGRRMYPTISPPPVIPAAASTIAAAAAGETHAVASPETTSVRISHAAGVAAAVNRPSRRRSPPSPSGGRSRGWRAGRGAGARWSTNQSPRARPLYPRRRSPSPPPRAPPSSARTRRSPRRNSSSERPERETSPRRPLRLVPRARRARVVAGAVEVIGAATRRVEHAIFSTDRLELVDGRVARTARIGGVGVRVRDAQHAVRTERGGARDGTLERTAVTDRPHADVRAEVQGTVGVSSEPGSSLGRTETTRFHAAAGG